MFRLRSCASSRMIEPYSPRRRSPCVSASRMPSVISLIAVRLPTWSWKRTLQPTRPPTWSPSSSAMRAATERAAMRRGCVWPMRPTSARPISSRILGSCVVLPDPVSPHTITTGCFSTAARISSRRALIGSAGSKRMPLARSREDSLNVARDQVDLEVDPALLLQPAQRRHGAGMRDQEGLEHLALDRVHRQAHAVDADRALAGDVARERLGRLDREDAVSAPGDFPDAVDVAGDEVAAERV